jgi:hypothetical protein
MLHESKYIWRRKNLGKPPGRTMDQWEASGKLSQTEQSLGLNFLVNIICTI